jgi:hypothetical protein
MGKVHCENYGLVDVSRVGVTNQGEKNFVAIVGGSGTFGGLGSSRKNTSALKNVGKIVLLVEKFGDFCLWEVDSKFEASGTTMVLCE